MSGRIAVAIDGPAGSGKSSVSRAAARSLGYDYQDTGAAYRALAWFALERGVNTEDPDEVISLLPDFDYRLGTDPDDYYVRVGDTDVVQAIREPRVTAVVSHVARVPEVRANLVQRFRDVIASGHRPGIITEGRDITTVVAPDAPVRILLTASEEARMGRRAAEIVGQSAEDVGREMTSRDNQDSRVIDFMNAANGVTTIDSTNLDFDATTQAVVDLIRSTTG
ncbi:MAG: (d)CMP kinase [Homoserinimonas sp.]